MKLSHKRLLSLVAVVVPAAAVWSVLVVSAPKASRADIAAGRQDYMVQGRESQVRDMMDEYLGSVGTNSPGADTATEPDFANRNLMQSVVSFTASSNGEIVAYDHWEDGLAADPFNQSDPMNATTLYFNVQRGQSISLLSTNNPPGATNTYTNNDNCDAINTANITGGTSCEFTGNTASPTVRSCAYYCAAVLTGSAQPYIARANDDIRFDGGDRISAIGGPITVVRRLNPLKEAFAGGALEELSFQSLRGFLNFVVPVGQGGTGTASSFSYSRAFVTAFYDNTVLTVNNGSATVQVTLNAGQTYSTRGKNTLTRKSAVDEDDDVPQIELLVGTRIDATKEVVVSIGNAGASANHIDLESLLPVRAYGRDFIVPVGTAESPVNASTVARLFLFNPNAQSATVTVYDRRSPAGGPLVTTATDPGDVAGATTTSIAGNGQVIHLLAKSTWGNTPSYPIATRIRSTLPIWGFVIYDADRGGKDWSHSPFPTRFLENEYVVPDTPSTAGGTASGNCIFIAPTQDNTTVRFYLPDGDEVADIMDIDGSGVVRQRNAGNDSNDSDDCPFTRFGCSTLDGTGTDYKYVLRTYTSPGYDPYATGNRTGAICVGGGSTSNPVIAGRGVYANLAGTRIVADKPIVAVYGQNGEVQEDNAGDDFGYSLVPPSLLLLEDLLVTSIRGNPGSIPSGTGAAFDLVLAATAGQVDQVRNFYAVFTLDDDWIAGATVNAIVNHPGNAAEPVVCTQINGAVTNAEPYGPLAAVVAGRDRFVCELSPPVMTSDVFLDGARNLAITVPLTTNVALGTANQVFDVEMYGEVGGQSVRPTATRTFTRSYLGASLAASSAIDPTGATVAPGAELRYTYTLTNSDTGNTITGMVVRMVIPDGLEYVSGNADVTGGTCAQDNITGELVCTVTNNLAVAPNATTPTSTTLSFDVQAQVIPGGTTVTASGSASGSNGTTAASNSFTTEVLSTDLVVTTSASTTYTATPGSFTVTVRLTNNSDFPITTVSTTLNQPAGTTVTGSPFATANVPANSFVDIVFPVSVAAAQPDATVYSFSPQVTATESTVPVGGNVTNVTVDASGPTLSVSAQPSPPQNTVAISGDVSDNLGVALLSYQLCDATTCSNCGSATALTIPTPPATAYSASNGGARGGTYCVLVTAVDTADNSSTASITNYTIVDTIPPNAPVVTAPSDEALLALGNNVVFTGTAEPGVEVIISFTNGVTLYSQTVVANGSGNWTATFAAGAFVYGHSAVTVRADDGANLSGAFLPIPDTAPTGYSVNFGRPATLTLSSPLGNPVIGAGGTTVTGGGAEPGATVIVNVPGVGSSEVTANGAGQWIVVTPGGLPNGQLNIEVRQRNQYGIESLPLLVPVQVDANAPAAPVVTSPVVNPAPGIVSASGFTVVGTAEPGSVITVTVPGMNPVQAVADGGGNFSVIVPGPIGDRLIDVTVTATDNVGNQSPATVLPLYADSGAPLPPVLNSPSDNQLVPGTNIPFTGTGEPGSTVTVTIGGSSATGVVDDNGNFVVVFPGPLGEGPHVVTVTQTDPANQTSTPVNVNVVVDSTPPLVPTVGSITENPGGGIVVGGTAEPGSTVTVTVGGTTVTTTAGSDGNYSVVVPDAPRAGDLTVVSTDSAGNQSLPFQRGYELDGNGDGIGNTNGNTGNTNQFGNARIIGGVGRGCQAASSGDAALYAIVAMGLLFRLRRPRNARQSANHQ